MRETAGGLYSEHPGWGFGDHIALHMLSLYVRLPGTIHLRQLPFAHSGALALGS